MKIKKLNQQGFAVVEAILIVVILAIAGGTGYFVYHSNKKATSTYNAASKSASSTVAKGTKGGKGGKGGPDTGPAKTEIFIIHEWGVSAAIPTPPKDAALIQYQFMADSKPQSALFTTQELIDADPACSADHAPGGLIARGGGGDPFLLSDGTSSGKTVKEELATGGFKPYKQVGGYYYWYVHAQSGCGDIAKTGQLQTAASNEVKQIVTHLQQDSQTE